MTNPNAPGTVFFFFPFHVITNYCTDSANPGRGIPSERDANAFLGEGFPVRDERGIPSERDADVLLLKLHESAAAAQATRASELELPVSQ